MKLVKIFWVFILGCLFGWLVETVFTYFNTLNLQSRQGLIYGPFAPVYGLGAVSFYLVLPKLKSNLSIFFTSALLGSTVEYFCSFFQEYFFGTISWDYSGTFLNLNGRTNLTYCIIWGIIGLFFIKIIYPKINVIDKILNKSSFKYATAIVMLFMVFNITISSIAVYRQKQRLQNISAKTGVGAFLDTYYPDYIINRAYSNKTYKGVIR